MATTGSKQTNGHVKTVPENRPGEDDRRTGAEEEEEEEVVEIRCGYGACRPRFLQVFNNPKAICFFLCCFSFVNGFGLNGNNSISTTSYERRFQLSTSNVGWITSSSDISAAIFGVIIGFYGNKRNKPRIIFVAFFISAFGYMLLFLPHFVMGLYDSGSTENMMCSATETAVVCEEGDRGIQGYIWFLVAGMLLVGVGGTTLYTVGFALIDDSVPASVAPIYFSLVGLFILVGATAGFVVGGFILNSYVDFDKVSASEIGLTPEDPRWVGAWWVGFLAASCMMIFVSLPFSAYGSELPTAKKVRETRVSETHATTDDSVAVVGKLGDSIKLRDLPGNAWHLLHNPVFMCVVLANCFLGVVTVASATFIPKFIENLFEVTSSTAALLSGVCIISGAGLGQIFSGVMISKLQLKVEGTLKLLIIAMVIAMVTFCGYFITCDQSKLVGWNSPYYNNTDIELKSSCNDNCHCAMSDFEKVCDSDGNAFFSPCLAGCTSRIDTKIHGSCACVSPLVNGTTVSFSNCTHTSCSLLYVFLVFSFFSAFTLSSTSIMSLTIILRSTHEHERTFALGILNFVARIFGTIPGPVIYGTVVDSACVIWGDSCGSRTSCWLYDNKKMARYLAVLGFSFMSVSIVIFSIGYKLYKPPKSSKYKETSPTVVEEETRVTRF